MPTKRTMTPEARSELRRKIVDVADQRPDFISTRLASVIERATAKACEHARELDHVEKPAVRYG